MDIPKDEAAEGGIGNAAEGDGVHTHVDHTGPGVGNFSLQPCQEWAGLSPDLGKAKVLGAQCRQRGLQSGRRGGAEAVGWRGEAGDGARCRDEAGGEGQCPQSPPVP